MGRSIAGQNECITSFAQEIDEVTVMPWRDMRQSDGGEASKLGNQLMWTFDSIPWHSASVNAYLECVVLTYAVTAASSNWRSGARS